MGDLWSDENKYRTWLKVEVLACEAMAKKGKVPAKALKTIKEKAAFSVARIEESRKRPNTTSSPSPPTWRSTWVRTLDTSTWG